MPNSRKDAFALLQNDLWIQIHELKNTDPASFHKHWKPLEDILSALLQCVNTGSEMSLEEIDALRKNASSNIEPVQLIAGKLAEQREAKKQARKARNKKRAARRQASTTDQVKKTKPAAEQPIT